MAGGGWNGSVGQAFLEDGRLIVYGTDGGDLIAIDRTTARAGDVVGAPAAEAQAPPPARLSGRALVSNVILKPEKDIDEGGGPGTPDSGGDGDEGDSPDNGPETPTDGPTGGSGGDPDTDPEPTPEPTPFDPDERIEVLRVQVPNGTGGSQTLLFDRRQVAEIVVEAGGGDDRVGIAGNVVKTATLIGGSGADALFAGRGPTLLAGGKGDDFLNGGRGDDTLEGGAVADRLRGGRVLAGARITGEGGGVSFDGSISVTDTASGMPTIARDGDDILHGGDGVDFAYYHHRGDDLRLSLDDARNDGAADEHDWLFDVEGLYDGTGDDVLEGGDGRGELVSIHGADTLLGYGGNDVLRSHRVVHPSRPTAPGQLPDLLDGGAGNDSLVVGEMLAGDVLRGGAGSDVVSVGWSIGGADGIISGGDGGDLYYWQEVGVEPPTEIIDGFEMFGSTDRDAFAEANGVSFDLVADATA